MPRVVIGAILFNHASEFREALESILAQTYEDFAIVLVDDGSSDDTPAIAREYEGLDHNVPPDMFLGTWWRDWLFAQQRSDR